jgi:D-alanine-D-alanine ligase
MKIVVTYSSKDGLIKEYNRRYKVQSTRHNALEDYFAEGDSFETIQQVIDAIALGGRQVIGFEANDELAANLELIHPDLVFNMAEGLWGDFRESYVPVICERLSIPYTGSDPLTLGICLNKARAKEILSYHGIPNAPFKIFYTQAETALNGFGFPAIVKPVSEGSSKGIFDNSVVENHEQAQIRIREALIKYDQPILLEKFLPGQEYTVAVWGNGDKIEVLPIVAIDYSQLPEGAKPIYSYEAKWIWDRPENPLEIFKCPAELTSKLAQDIQNLVKQVYRVMRVRDWCRIDVRLDENRTPHILEINPIPGILPDPRDNSCFPKAARTAGYDYTAMLNKVIQICAERYGLN